MSSTSPRATSSTPTPRRLTATRATADTSSRVRPRLCRPRTVTDCEAPVVRWTTSSSPSRIVPAPSVPVTTVPLPRTEKDRSTHRRVRPLRSGAGSEATRSSRAPRRASMPWPVRADTASAALPARLVRPTCSSASARAGPGSARSLRVTTTSPREMPRASTAARCSADWGRQPSSAATTSSTAGAGPEPGEHVADEALVPGHVDEGHVGARGQGRPGVAEVDRHAAAALLGPPVGLDPGQRADQGGLAVVDVPGGRDDVHVSAPLGSSTSRTARMARSTSGSRAGGTQRRSTRQRPRSTRATTPVSPRRRRSA